MGQNNEDEWYDGGESDKDIDELNKEKNPASRIGPSNTQISTENIKPNESYNKLNNEFDPFNKNIEDIINSIFNVAFVFNKFLTEKISQNSANIKNDRINFPVT